jgi:hypothetical protein
MIYFMTAFFLWHNQAPTFWWFGFVSILMLEVMWFIDIRKNG